MSSKFHVFQLWCTKCSRAGTAAFRNTPNIVCSKYWRDSETVGGTADELSSIPGPTVTALPQVLDGGIAFPDRIAFPQVLAVPKRSHSHATMRFPSTGRSQTVEGTAESLSPKYGHFQNTPCCIQNHAENALPQVLTGFRTNRRRVLAVPGPTVKVFPQVLAQNYERSRRTTDPGTRGCGVAVSGMRGCGGRCEERNTVFVKGSKLGRSHSEACSFWKPCGEPDCPERKVGRQGFRTKRAGTHFPTFRL